MKKSIGIVFLLIGLIVGVLGFKYVNKIFLETTQKEGYIYIFSNATFDDVKKQLIPFVENIENFEWVAHQKNYPNVIKGGKYKIEEGWNNNQLVNHLRSGKQEEVKVQFNNVETLNDLVGKVAQQIEPDSITLLSTILNTNFLRQNNLNEENVKQLFLPDTYNFYWNTSAEKFVNRMVKEHEKFWTKKRKEQASQLGMTPLQVTSLAAIVQKETAKHDERPKVARLYLNRLEKNWKLQSDPTVIYAVKKRIGFDTIIKRVLFPHLREESPYNTYLHYGVPPAPITVPEPNAIDAVLNAPKHDYMFMCASVENWGYHEFAQSLADHEVNRRKYINWINQNQKP